MARRNGKTVSLHRYRFELAHGELKGNQHLHHKCRNKNCINIDHLEVVTPHNHPGTGGELNRAKTHCPQGHTYTPPHLLLYRGRRYCYTCIKLRSRKRRMRGLKTNTSATTR